MADDMGKIDKSEPCVNISGYAVRDGVSKYVTSPAHNVSASGRNCVFSSPNSPMAVRK